ncbi:hypothetical protein HMP09_0192 [Sphingomonas sp. HMP9]|uniref:hypothetical protein n=1 Tax=Sphingomonas sp. HMP9 TaxID=1517554 RepID=UPI00159692F0|nr:hypothetical protein [Sphingomonas sp. HMP9]BCA60958.1 hypothetical protein HMP09_0192 [Sphingomonas sp. HMP9]
MAVNIEHSDRIARCLIYPQLFKGNIHANSKLWEFGKREEDGGSHQSAVLRRLAETSAEVHRIGCKIATAQNDNLKERLSPAPIPLDKKRYYCGFRDATVGALLEGTDEYRISIKSLPEFGEEAHVDVGLFIATGVPKNRHANLRTDAGLALAFHFSPASPHLCECDNGDDNHPFVKIGTDSLPDVLPGPWQGISVMIAGGVDNSVTELAVGFADVFKTTVLDEMPAASALSLPPPVVDREG